MIDTHAHLDQKAFAQHIPDVIQRAKDAGVNHVMLVAMLTHAPDRVFAIARENADFCDVIVGLHPHDASQWSPDVEADLRGYLADAQVRALGEIGLDFFRDWSPRDKQITAFREQCHIAKELDLPIVLHCRDAYPETMAILREVLPAGWHGVAHCFSGSVEDAQAFLDFGLHVSFAGNVTKTKNDSLRDAAAVVPLDRLLIETDAPFMIPRGVKGARHCEPAHVRFTLETLAQVKDLPPVIVEEATDNNAHAVFRLAVPDVPRQRTIVYPIRGSLYVNLTNRCDCRCAFCPREKAPIVHGHWLGMDESEEPSAEEVLDAIGDPRRYDEIVFVGFGEPTLRLDVLMEIARTVKEKGGKLRVDTNGHANLIHGRNVAAELGTVVDRLSISLNTHDAAHYARIMRPQLDGDSYEAMLDFIRKAARHCEVTLTALDGFPGVDMDKCRQIAQDLGVKFRDRRYQALG